jgi:RNA-directed DNA polymerase
MKSAVRFITTRLKLKVNEQKSAVAEPWERKFLGFSFTNAETPKRRIAPKAVVRFKERVRELTSRTRGVSIERMAEELARYLRGWIGYFGNCETPRVLQRPRGMDQMPTSVGDLEAVEAWDDTLR